NFHDDVSTMIAAILFTSLKTTAVVGRGRYSPPMVVEETGEPGGGRDAQLLLLLRWPLLETVVPETVTEVTTMAAQPLISVDFEVFGIVQGNATLSLL
ncbi:hypothetical protein Hamer_G002882, partial [Homarus americanus]